MPQRRKNSDSRPPLDMNRTLTPFWPSSLQACPAEVNFAAPTILQPPLLTLSLCPDILLPLVSLENILLLLLFLHPDSSFPPSSPPGPFLCPWLQTHAVIHNRAAVLGQETILSYGCQHRVTTLFGLNVTCPLPKSN